jgi:hypothetical protein
VFIVLYIEAGACIEWLGQNLKENVGSKKILDVWTTLTVYSYPIMSAISTRQGYTVTTTVPYRYHRREGEMKVIYTGSSESVASCQKKNSKEKNRSTVRSGREREISKLIAP